MTDAAERLLALLRGEGAARPPFWEPWFGMDEFCRRRFGGDRIAMALELGMAALSLGGVNTNCHFTTRSLTSEGTQRYDKGTLRNRRQLAERGDVPDWSQDIVRLKQRQAELAEAGLACWLTLPWCLHTVATSMGLERFALACYDEPDFVREAFAWVEGRSRQAIERVVAAVRPDFVLLDGDCAYKNGLMLNPQMFRALVLDITRQTVARLRALGIRYTFHSDGKVHQLLPMLIELGFAAFHGCEKQANDLGDLVQRFGDEICLAGNMDVVFLARAAPDEVRRETLKMLEVGGRKRRFIAACNTSPLDYIPDENYLSFARAIREYGRG